MQQQTQRKFFPQEEIAMGHREELLSTLSSTGLPYLFMLLSSLYQSTSANICSFPICKCMLNKAIYFSRSQGSPSINLSLIVCSGCNYPCRSQRPTFKLETKFLGLIIMILPSCRTVLHDNHTWNGFSIHVLVHSKNGWEIIRVQSYSSLQFSRVLAPYSL